MLHRRDASLDGYPLRRWTTGVAVDDGIEAAAFRPLSDDAWQGLAAEAGALVARLADREPAVYGRCAHWWSTLPSAEVRVLPGGHQPLTAS
ncbi:MAG: hypothetical protein WKF58_00155 [Ilumatobacteraceae bacterium]